MESPLQQIWPVGKRRHQRMGQSPTDGAITLALPYFRLLLGRAWWQGVPPPASHFVHVVKTFPVASSLQPDTEICPCETGDTTLPNPNSPTPVGHRVPGQSLDFPDQQWDYPLKDSLLIKEGTKGEQHTLQLLQQCSHPLVLCYTSHGIVSWGRFHHVFPEGASLVKKIKD